MRTELQIIGFIRNLTRRGGTAVPRTGVGDDAAVVRLPKGHDLLVTTDLFVEGVHFRRPWLTASSAGRRALSRALSDIAAMGGRPHWAFLSLALPSGWDPAWVQGFLRGFAAAAKFYGVALVGGDTGASGSKIFLADVAIGGSVPRGTAVLRSGARPGDALFVSGRLGATAAALTAGRPLPPIRPRLRLGQYLRRRRLARAMIDLSDGLSTDLNHLAEESQVGAEVEVRCLPCSGTLEQALHGGEEYELLFSVSPRSVAQVPRTLDGISLTRIGRVVEERGVRLLYPDGRRERLRPGGWEHFRRHRGRA